MDLRASDADREATVTRLHAAAVEGRLDGEELEERVQAAYAARYCKELTPLTADVTPPSPPAAVACYPPVFVKPASSPNPFAIASLVCAVVWFGFLGSLAAVVFGHVALSRIRASGGRARGRGLAVAGLVLGYLGLALMPLWLLAGIFGA